VTPAAAAGRRVLQPNGASGLVSLREGLLRLSPTSQREPCRTDVPPVQMRAPSTPRASAFVNQSATRATKLAIWSCQPTARGRASMLCDSVSQLAESLVTVVPTPPIT
jgi:hypothetical protein